MRIICTDGDALFAMGKAARKGVKRLIPSSGRRSAVISKVDKNEARKYFEQAADLNHQKAINALEKLNCTQPKKQNWLSLD